MANSSNIFDLALTRLDQSGQDFYGPVDFSTYKREVGFGGADTAASVSINAFEKGFPQNLKSAGVMVLRLGSDPVGKGGTTQFILNRVRTDWNDFFLFDRDLLGQLEPRFFLPNVSERSLFPFRLLPRMVESSFVNLGLASGLVQEFLGIQIDQQNVPATGQSTFTFDFLVHSDSVRSFHHHKGQVEIDSLICGRRADRECLFVIEAKHSREIRDLSDSSLPKHKLIYPLAAIASRSDVGSHITLVPVYMRTWYSKAGLNFLIAECSYTRDPLPVLSSLQLVRSAHFILRGFGDREE
jgi:hypothetical protein